MDTTRPEESTFPRPMSIEHASIEWEDILDEDGIQDNHSDATDELTYPSDSESETQPQQLDMLSSHAESRATSVTHSYPPSSPPVSEDFTFSLPNTSSSIAPVSTPKRPPNARCEECIERNRGCHFQTGSTTVACLECRETRRKCSIVRDLKEKMAHTHRRSWSIMTPPPKRNITLAHVQTALVPGSSNPPSSSPSRPGQIHEVSGSESEELDYPSDSCSPSRRFATPASTIQTVALRSRSRTNRPAGSQFTSGQIKRRAVLFRRLASTFRELAEMEDSDSMDISTSTISSIEERNRKSLEPSYLARASPSSTLSPSYESYHRKSESQFREASPRSLQINESRRQHGDQSRARIESVKNEPTAEAKGPISLLRYAQRMSSPDV